MRPYPLGTRHRATKHAERGLNGFLTIPETPTLRVRRTAT
jgi:hypothetical protein